MASIRSSNTRARRLDPSARLHRVQAANALTAARHMPKIELVLAAHDGLWAGAAWCGCLTPEYIRSQAHGYAYGSAAIDTAAVRDMWLDGFYRALEG